MDLILGILAISAALSALTYVIGTLLYSIPLPLPSLKRWAPILISDSITTFTLTSSFFLILWFLDKTYALIGMDRESYIKEILEIDKGIASTYITIDYLSKVMKTVFNKFPLGKVLEALYVAYSRIEVFNNLFTRPFLDIFLSSLKLAVYSWTALYILARISELLLPGFLSIGILLMSIPFKITKSAGAFMFSLGVVTYVMTPLVIPIMKLFVAMSPTIANFVEMIASGVFERGPYNVFYLQGTLLDEQGNHVPYALVYFCDLKGICGIYPTNPKGFFDTAYTLGGVPWPRSEIKVELLGIKIDVSEEDWKKIYVSPNTILTNSKIKVKGLIVPDPGIAIYLPCSLYYYTSPPKFETSQDGYLIMRFKFVPLENCQGVSIAFSGIFDEKTVGIYLSSNVKNGKLEHELWNGIEVWKVTFDVDKGNEVDIIINGRKKGFTPPSLFELGYLSNKLGLQLLSRVSKQKLSTADILLAPFFLASIPYIHLTTISITIYSLATLLSGGVKRIVVRTW
ncbi:hypothetical protein EYM_07610 [Ignicoccus islandicus DSM 13165]|uniref:Uncharacterized protein n=1 Tax=Ignicoccus islandicus DSM 13165 TaxID=940295 RepID=A0A0U3FAT1_9CREN|nr:hypothetical protein [Ignicoccus islandicus]ALU12793.1 hypothetical protein EYM_07610 [Ignicoccus islandicus DSM 13165]